MKKSLGVLLLLSAILSGCLGDEVDRPQVVAQLILPPDFVYYKAITNTTDLQVRWSRSLTDTQGNFKGYFIQLFTSEIDTTSLINEDIVQTEIDSVHVGPGDMSYTFHNLSLLGRYTTRVWGEQFSSADTLVLSENHSFVSFNYDSRAVLAPTAIFASSASRTSVNLSWSRSNSDKQLGFSGYIIRYRDPDNSASHVTYLARIDTFQSYISVPVPANPNLGELPEKKYEFWIKAIRRDSVESDDSVGIIWSGAERSGLQVNMDTGVFIGLVSQNIYGLAMIELTKPSAYFTVHYDGTTVTLAGLNSTLFVDHSDIIDSTGMDRFYFTKPFEDNEFSQSSISLPPPPKSGGAQVYALMPSGRARIFIQSFSDTVGGSHYVTTTTNGVKTISIQASFQLDATKLKFF